MSEFNKPFAIQNEFSLVTCKDGNYWIRYMESDNFYQVSEDGSKIQYYDGDVFDLTFAQLVKELENK